ncbi:MAG: hypothetical protein AAF501_21095 [Pseudomonadota bacterium]
MRWVPDFFAVRSFCVGLLLAGGLSVTASAATTFSFGDGADDQARLSVQSGGIGLTIDAFGADYDPLSGIGTAGAVNQGPNGLGVSGNPESGRIAGGEALLFTFTTPVTLTSLILHEAKRENERFQIYDSENRLVVSQALDGDDLSALHTLSLGGLGISGLSFAIVGLERNRSGDDNPNRGIRVNGLTIDGPIGISAVPLPAPILLSMAGLGVFGFFGARRRRATSL